MDEFIEPLPVTARVGRQCMAVEYLPCIQQICEYEDLKKKLNPKRRYTSLFPLLSSALCPFSSPPFPFFVSLLYMLQRPV